MIDVFLWLTACSKRGRQAAFYAVSITVLVTLRKGIFVEIVAQRKEVLLHFWRVQVKGIGGAGAIFGEGRRAASDQC